jgi:two-component system OmpR family response regulator
LELSPKEFDLLAYLLRHVGRIRTRDQILASVWGEDEFIDRRTVDVHVRWLRTKIEQDPARPKRVVTVRGVGYKFSEEG